MKKIKDTCRIYAWDRKFLFSLAISILMFLVAVVFTFFSIIYATDRSSNSVTDIILSNVRVFDLDGIFIYGPVVFWVIIVFFLISAPQKLPFTLKSTALFLFIRSAFASMTHIGPFPVHVALNTSGIWGVFTSGSDLFFSSHAGLPFLMALIFWKNKILRYFSVTSSIFFGAVVLLAHLHYSIDVFAAFFITYTIYCMAAKFFAKDKKIFDSSRDAITCTAA